MFSISTNEPELMLYKSYNC